jgi:hypothetical protein
LLLFHQKSKKKFSTILKYKPKDLQNKKIGEITSSQRELIWVKMKINSYVGFFFTTEKKRSSSGFI